jgi:hypothetical protein
MLEKSQDPHIIGLIVKLRYDGLGMYHIEFCTWENTVMMDLQEVGYEGWGGWSWLRIVSNSELW